MATAPGRARAGLARRPGRSEVPDGVPHDGVERTEAPAGASGPPASESSASSGPSGSSRSSLPPVRPLRPRVRAELEDLLTAVRAVLVGAWAVARATLRICLRYRVTGLAAEAGFFALLSLPPLVLGLVASVGWIGPRLGTPTLTELRSRIQDLADRVLTPSAVEEVLLPTIDEVTTVARPGVVGVGVLLALWSGSRVLNVYLDTISIMYGLGGQRGILRTRMLSVLLYVGATIVGSLAIPLVLIGPRLLGSWLPDQVGWLLVLYWPVVSVVVVAGLATLYHVSTPVRTPWARDLPGAAVALVIWVVSSYLLRWVISASVGSTSIYGPLATPIVVLIWLYFLAIAVLIGAAVNAGVDELWPSGRREALRAMRAAEERREEAEDPHVVDVVARERRARKSA